MMVMIIDMMVVLVMAGGDDGDNDGEAPNV